MATANPVRFGKYLLLDPIAVGGMAELFRAKMIGDAGFEKIIVVKKILPHLVGEKGLVDSFIHEARLAAHLQHENIVRTFDFGKMGNDYFIAMEYLFGRNLRIIRQRAREKGRELGMEHILYLAGGMCKGLEYAHNLKDYQGKYLKIVHRDISPPNIFVTFQGELKIVDFGVAKAASQNTTTQLGVIKGKVAYMSPEQAEGMPIDHRSDIFALGAVLYEIITGERMYAGETMEVLAKARNCQYTPALELSPDLPGPLANILEKALAKDREQRYQSCGDMLADLDDCAFELRLRPTDRSMAALMQELFAQEIPVEEQALAQVAGLDRSSIHEAVSHSGDTVAPYDQTGSFSGLEMGPDQGTQGACPACKKPVDSTESHCPWCDAPLPQSNPDEAVSLAKTAQLVDCPSCGQKIRDDFKVCNYCGVRLDETRSLVAQGAAPGAGPDGPGLILSHAAPATPTPGQYQNWNPEQAPPVFVHFNAGKGYREGSMDFLELAVTNNTTALIDHLKIRISGRLVKGMLKEQAPFNLESRMPRVMRMAGFIPQCAGKDPLTVAVEGSLGGKYPFFLLGSIPIEVAEREDTSPNLNVNISAKGPLIVDMEDALPSLAGRKKKKPVDKQPNRWMPVELFWDKKRQESVARRFPTACITPQDCPLDSDVYTALANLSPESAPRSAVSVNDGHSYILVAGSTLLLGRKRDANHVPAFLFPEENNEHLNVKVSRNHCRIFIKENRLFIRDTSSNGTFIGKRRLMRNEDTHLENGHVVIVGGVLELLVNLFTNGERIIAAQLTRQNNKTNEHYILAPGPVPMGTDPKLPIRVPSAPDFLAAIYHNPLEHLWRLRTIQGFAGPPKDVRLRLSHPLAFGKARCRFSIL